MSEGLVATLESRFQADPDIEGFLPLLRETVPAVNPRTRLSEPIVTLAGIDAERQTRLGGLRRVDGGRADLAALGEDQALVSRKLADKLDVRAGDALTVYAQDREWTLSVAGIVADEIASGVFSVALPNQATRAEEAGGLAAPLSTVQRITGRAGRINWVSIALRGDVRSGVERTDAAEARLEEYFAGTEGKRAAGLGDLTVNVDPLKQDALAAAETFGNQFTAFFLVFGLFSITAGVLLIFLIFVMLTAERKTEMGMARAVGARRSNLVQSFVADGMAYNVMAGAVGAA